MSVLTLYAAIRQLMLYKLKREIGVEVLTKRFRKTILPHNR
jgi:hypothetical protein